MRTTLVAIMTAAVFAAPAAAQVNQPTVQLPATGADYVTSPNVEYLGAIKDDIGQTTGSRIVGNRLYVTSAKNMSIYDISDPTKPTRIGLIHLNVAWENEEVPTNGKLLGISSDWFNATVNCGIGTACQQFFDVSDPSNVKELPALPDNGDHTADCVLDCKYLFGNTGNITDLSGALDGSKPPTVIGNWQTLIKPQMAARGFANGVRSCHHIREIKPGYLMAACQPYAVFHVVGDASVLQPKVDIVGNNPDGRFVHSVRWPRGGDDKFAFQGGETNFTSVGADPTKACDDPDRAAFATLDASHAWETGRFSQPLDEYRPVQGTYTDGNTATEIAGCSVHWFQEHPSFNNGGLVALAAYDNGIRFLQIKPDGKIVEQGYFQPLGFETSAPRWVPGTNILYSIDYARGIDILRWKGDTYVPNAQGKVKHKKGRIRGTNGRQPLLPALTARQKAFATREVSLLHAQGWFKGYCELAARKYGTA